MQEKTKFSRREFLKVLGATTSAAAVGCSQELPEKMAGYVSPPNEVIPGIAVWYAGSCGECSAGCGVLVRTREGRAVKLEGNPHHPVNRGGLCALGQASIQAHYDPDRIREPLKRELKASFVPTEWKSSIEAVAAAVKDCPPDKEILFISEPLSGSAVALVEELKKAAPRLTHVEYELLSRDAIDLAATAVYGNGVTTHFDFSKADVIASFGADFLESWISPVEFSRQWAERRKPDSAGGMSYYVHFEPRLSLTAANADRFVKTNAGSELFYLAALLRAVSGMRSASGAVTSALGSLDLSDANLKKLGVSMSVVNDVAKRLVSAGTSLVVAGGSSLSGDEGVTAATLALLINETLGNVGKSVVLRESSKRAASGHAALAEIAQAVATDSRKLAVIITTGANPVFTSPAGSPIRAMYSKAGLVVAISTHIDETTQFATVVLPRSTSFESWSDAEPAPGVWNLNQPSMQPIYATQGLGDTILAILLQMGKTYGTQDAPVRSFHDFMRAQWKTRTGANGNFEAQWLKYVERGGSWDKPVTTSVARSATGNVALPAPKPRVDGELKFLAFATLVGDSRGANRAWLQELPDPIANAVWGSWVEMSPKTAAHYNVKTGDIVQTRTANGAVGAPVIVSKYVADNVLAVPIGQGHEAYGRYAQGVGANPIAILDPTTTSGGLSFVSTVAADGGVRRVSSSERLVQTFGSDTQEKRGIIRTVGLSTLAHAAAGHHVADAHLAESAFEDHGKSSHGAASSGHGEEKHAAKHHDPMALGPQPEPPQMYKQMNHPMYRWGMTIDLAACTGCSACVVACSAENNVPIVGKDLVSRGREMWWIRVERYFDGPEEAPVEGFLPMFCQHCANAPCEPVCPVFATYHNEEGLNTMVYNRCVGTRYCSNNCSYKVRRFNWFHYKWPEPLTWQLNPDVTVREVGIMEKCSFCNHRIIEAKNNAKNEGREVRDGEIATACSATCPTKAITFGNLLDHDSEVYKLSQNARAYKVLDQYINTQPAVSYLARVRNDQKTTGA
ncbi:MAG: 4Fe-4S dicluster domain-containing protein [Deltaproteobacteria bacterium]|nr:4Fe-4S dicluster domain-containing protein [Deltaproteobacteria bacterium]